MRRALTVVSLAVLLAACTKDPSPGAAPSAAPSAASTHVAQDTHDVAADRDAKSLVQLCAVYCESLIAQQNVCPTGTTNILGCTVPLAKGSDAVNALANLAASLDRSDPERYEDLDRAIADERDAYDTFSDNTSCNMAYDINDPGLAEIFPGGRAGLVTCGLQATTVGYRQSSVGAVLKNLANG